MNRQLVDQTSYWVAAITFILGMILFYSDTGFFWGSMTAALLAAALAWISYILMRWLIMAFS